jgi:hypothetical protein
MKTTLETITRINGNGQKYTTDLPLIILNGFINDVALNHIKENTGLEFKKHYMGYSAQPINSNQVLTLFLTYNFKTRYFDNWNHKNTIVLKCDHHVGFDVDSICYACCKHNNIVTNGLMPNQRLSC